MATEAESRVICSICNLPVTLLQPDTCADEKGNAVHSDCYVKTIAPDKPPAVTAVAGSRSAGSKSAGFATPTRQGASLRVHHSPRFPTTAKDGTGAGTEATGVEADGSGFTPTSSPLK